MSEFDHNDIASEHLYSFYVFNILCGSIIYDLEKKPEFLIFCFCCPVDYWESGQRFLKSYLIWLTGTLGDHKTHLGSCPTTTKFSSYLLT